MSLLQKQNISWKDEAKFFKKVTTFLAVVATLSAMENLKLSNKLNKEHNENKVLVKENNRLQRSVQVFYTQALNLRDKNNMLQDYANTAQSFALGISPILSENDSSCQKKNCPDCKAIDRANETELNSFKKAMKTLRINSEDLKTLRQGPLHQEQR